MAGFRVFTIEDHPLIVEGLKSRFKHPSDVIKIVGSAYNVDEAIKSADATDFDIFFLDLMIPGSEPLENVARLKKAFPGKLIVILTGENSLYWMEQMSNAGVNGYLLKSAEKAVIKSAIEKITAGIVVFPDIFHAVAQRESLMILQSLRFKPIEKEIVRLLSQGMNQKQVAEKVGKTRWTVEKILKKIRTQVEAKNNEQLVQYFMLNKII